MTKTVLVVVASILALFAVGCGADDQRVKPFKAGATQGDDDDDDAPRKTTTTAKSPTGGSSESATTKSPTSLVVDTKSCSGLNEPAFDYTAVASGSLPAATGGTITDGTWVMQSAELENAGAAALSVKRKGMIRFSGNRYAWHDGTTESEVCWVGTFTTTGSSLNFTKEDPDPMLNGGTATVTFTVEPDGAFTLKRGAEEAYHYAKQ